MKCRDDDEDKEGDDDGGGGGGTVLAVDDVVHVIILSVNRRSTSSISMKATSWATVQLLVGSNIFATLSFMTVHAVAKCQASSVPFPHSLHFALSGAFCFLAV